MGKLGAYLRPAPAGKTKTVYLENFKDEEGKPLPFVVKSISPKENEILVRRYSDEKGKSKISKEAGKWDRYRKILF